MDVFFLLFNTFDFIKTLYRTKIEYMFLVFDELCLTCTHLLLHILLLQK